MTEIKTLIPDIYLLLNRKDGWFDDRLATTLSQDITDRLRTHFGQEQRTAPTLRLSQMGPRCPRALWYSIHRPETAEMLPAWATIKYAYGHVIEALVVALAKAAGHEVCGEQDEVWVDGIRGHRDCIIDGNIVDVKSTTTMGFSKFRDGSIKNSDNFGYLDQLDGYLVGSANDELVRNKDSAFLLAVDKQLGHMCLYEHQGREDSIRHRVAETKGIIALDTPPLCTCRTQPDGKSGNIRLDTKASYSAYKFSCFPQLRTFLYSDGPRYLTKVERKPDVPEIDKNGKVIYN